MNGESEYWRGINNSKARQAWSTLLASYPWDAFFTSTDRSVRRRAHPLSVIERIRHTADGIALVSRLFIAAEEFQLGGWHGHGLVKWSLGSEALDYGSANNRFAERLSYAGYSRVEGARQIAAVSGYLAKYVIKDTPWEWNMSGEEWGTKFHLSVEGA